MKRRDDQHRPIWIVSLIVPLFVSLLAPGPAVGQTGGTDPFALGGERRLQIVVHILGEVDRPGEYLVPDDTDVLELVSKAGGTTEYGNLGSVLLKRRSTVTGAAMGSGSAGRVLKINLSDYLGKENAQSPPLLQPGDVVSVPRNKMRGWRTAFTMVRDVSVVVSTYLLYRKVVED